MLNLTDQNVSFILLSPCKEGISESDNFTLLSKSQSLLFSKEYSILSLTGYCGGSWDKSYIAYNESDNNALRKDAIFLMEQTESESIIVKYKGDSELKMIDRKGEEFPLSLHNYSEPIEGSKVFIFEGWYFTLRQERKYYLIETKDQIKKGMKLEYFNEGVWKEKEVVNPELEWSNMYQLLTKYKKLRAASN